MTSLSEIYRNVQNPLDNPQILDKLFSAYARSSRHTSNQDIVQGLYRQVIDLGENKDRSHVNRADREQFYVDKYNRWISKILSIKFSPEKIAQLGKAGQEFQEFQQFLQSVGKVNSYSDVINLRTNPSFNFDYDWEIEDFSWEHIQSYHMNFGREKRIDVKHRLYIGCQNQDVWKLLSIFSEKCENGNIPYYFKTPSFEIKRDDKIVIYADSENLAKYIDILNEIARENPEIVSRCGQPPILTGKVNEWIGIGDEPPRDEKGKHSFNEIRALAIDDAIEETLLNSLSSFMGQTVNYQGKNIRFEELFKQQAAKYIASKQSSNKNFKNLSQEQLQSMIERQLGGEITKGLSKLIAIKDNKTSPDINNFDKIFTINIGGQTIGIDIYGMDAITKTMIPVMQQIDPNFRNNAKIAILDKCKQYGIDDTFCFQQGTRQTFETIDRTGQAPKQPTIETAKKQEGQEPKKEEITVEQIEDQRNTAINSNEIVYRLNPYLLKQMIELPNGAKIPASQYIQEAVAPHIPSNGKIILNNGAEIPATQFIEEYILGEGQQKYKGDIVKLMAENTRANNGTIISRGQKINVVSIVDSLNPTLMGKMVTLPNGANIPASQYVQEVVAPYIPSNGKFILKNGAELSAQQFIEEFIMFEGQQKYSGDIKAIIDAYTKPNNGTIMANKQMYKAPETKQITTEKSDINQQKKQQFRTQTTQTMSRQQVEQKKAVVNNSRPRPRQTNYHEKSQQFRAGQNGTLTPQQVQQKKDIFENRGSKQEQTKTINTIDIVDMLNPTLVSKMIELPNGAKIPARQYIQEAVAPHIPSNGKIILNNGAEIPATQFIEEYVLGEGQQKYKGDIGMLMAENTRANNGTIISRGQKINVVSIVDSLNPTLMGKMVTLPNGAKIPASQYVQEVVAPYIPSNGKFILKNGAEIPATQFIEEAVMFVGQEKYNGDINALLNAMTVANNGTVSVGTDTKPPKGHVKRQEMGGVTKTTEETTTRKSTDVIMGQAVKKSLSKKAITTSEANKVTSRMGERDERKKLNQAKSNGTITPEQQQRLNELNRRLFSNPQPVPYHKQGQRKSNGQGMSR